MSRSAGASAGVADDSYSLRAVAKAFEALEAIRSSREPVSLNAVASNINLSKASAIRILYTLESLGYVRKTDEGYMSSDRQAPARVVEALLQHSVEPLRQLVQLTGETASLCAVFENHIEVILVVESPQLIRMANTTGRILPPHASSMGKSITAFQPADVRERLLRSYGTARITETTVCKPQALDAEFAKIRNNGYAEDWGESTPDAVCFGAPVLNQSGSAIAAVSVSMPKTRLESDTRQRSLIEAVQATSARITEALNASRRAPAKPGRN